MEENITKVTIISDLLTHDELQKVFAETDLTLIQLNSEDELRSGLDPSVLSAIIGGGVTLFATIATLITTTLVERYKTNKKEGLLIIKEEKAEIHIPFDVTDEELEKKLELVKKLRKIEQVFITEKKDG